MDGGIECGYMGIRKEDINEQRYIGIKCLRKASHSVAHAQIWDWKYSCEKRGVITGKRLGERDLFLL